MNNKLAVFGGKPIIKKKIPKYSSIGKNEIKSVNRVLKTGSLSGFYGSWRNGFFGGKEVKNLEKRWSKQFNCEHSISMNSNTSGLYCAMGAIGLSPGDEVIVPATTMSATAMCPLIYGGIPVFADIEDDTFSICVKNVKKLINKKTKAIIAVNLFGHPAELKKLRKLANKHKIYLIEDNAQAIMAKEGKDYCGTIGHIGVFSLNYHKHIHSGEGGICTTNDDYLAKRLQLIRNHAEAVVEDAKVQDLVNLVGFNLRLTELSAVIAKEQLKKLSRHVSKRIDFGLEMCEGVKSLKIRGIETPKIRSDCTHSFYNWVIKYDEKKYGVKRANLVKALQCEGVPCFSGYVKPLYLLPIFQKKIAIGNKGFPFNVSSVNYDKGICPTAEDLFENKIVGLECCAYDYSKNTQKKIVNSIEKVFSSIEKLKDIKLKE
ncbi:MAG: hypothetical protein CL572_04585 [Alphaproteobacteria bacterium]|nr:hypothetical protein [Alphaproteobacteria bacterium]